MYDHWSIIIPEERLAFVQRAMLAGFLAAFLLASAGCGEAKNAPLKVQRVIDGDTIVLADGRSVRYIGIDTPEAGETYFEEAKEANRRLVADKNIRLEPDVEEKDRFGRTLAYIYVNDTFVNVGLVQEGYARAYPYPPNIKYEGVFSNAEKEAKRKRIGIWSSRPQGSEIEIADIGFDPPGNDRENLNGEWVMIVSNTDTPVEMVGFSLTDDSNHVYSFGYFTLSARETVVVFSGSGADTPTSLYWGSKTPIWNNDGDTAYLKDAGGSLIDEYPY